MENSMEVPQKTKNRTIIWSSISTSGYIFEEKEDTNQKYTCTTMFIGTLFTIDKIWKQPKCPSTDECIKNIWYILMIAKLKIQ